jgi:hypothetical protein
MDDLRYFVPSLCAAMGVERPALASSAPAQPFGELQGSVERALVYCPDAFGLHALERFPALAERLVRSSTHAIDITSMTPPKTPVCYASLFTGATPEEHGIRRYERPVLACDTLFDALVRAGKRVAIVAVQDSSIDMIFRDRPIDYHSMAYDPLVTERVLRLVRADEHDVIVAYHQEYDDLLHRTGPFSELATRALEHHVDSWEILGRAAREAWRTSYVVAFCPDHGGHEDPSSGRGDHGDDSPEDMRVRHYFAIG